MRRMLCGKGLIGRAVSRLFAACLVAVLLVVCDSTDAWANGTWYANFRGGDEARVAVGDTCDMKIGNELRHDVPNEQLTFIFRGGVRGPDVYVRDVTINAGSGRDHFLFAVQEFDQ